MDLLAHSLVPLRWGEGVGDKVFCVEQYLSSWRLWLALGLSGPLCAPLGLSLNAFVTPWDALLDIFGGSDNRERHTVKIVHGATANPMGIVAPVDFCWWQVPKETNHII